MSASHVYGGTASFTNCLFDAKDGWGLAPANSWTAWLFYEPYSTSNITGGLIENCIIINPPAEGWYIISAVDSSLGGTTGMTTRNLIVRNNLIQPGKGGLVFYPRPGFPQYSEVHDNFNFVTGARILEIPERFA